MNEMISAPAPSGLRLGTLDDYARFGQLIAKTDYPPREFRGRPEACTAAVIHGAELGLGPMQALQSIAVINGRPAIFGDAALALVRASGLCVSVREGVTGNGDERYGFCEVVRRGDENTIARVFKIADAKAAKLWGRSGPWTEYPDRMLMLRARGFALRDAFPDVLRGLVTREEAQDYPPAAGGSPAPAIEARPEAVVEVVTVTPAAPGIVVEAAQADPADDSQATATAEDVSKALAAIARARTKKRLQDIRDTVWQRDEQGFYTPEQTREINSALSNRIDLFDSGELTE
jgi:hypothetical protein